MRTRSDPIYDGVVAAKPSEGQITEADIFERSPERRILGPGETIEDLMVLAGKRAIEAAGLAPSDVDRLYGYSTVSEYLEPNGLFKVHQGLGLPHRTMVVPLNNGFTNFITGVILAWEAILSGHCQRIMVNCGSGMSRNANYQAPHSLSAGDGAGAAIVGPSDRYTIMDFAEETYSDDEDYHGMSLKVRVVERHGVRTLQVDEHGLPVPTFEISEGGRRSFVHRGIKEPPRIVGQMLDQHGVSRDEITLITHQGPNAMMDAWSEMIRPKQYLHTMEQYGALALASVPVTLATCIEQVKTKYLVLASPGPGAHFAVLLIRV